MGNCVHSLEGAELGGGHTCVPVVGVRRSTVADLLSSSMRCMIAMQTSESNERGMEREEIHRKRSCAPAIGIQPPTDAASISPC
jgi:hypothetical protein